MTTLAEGDADGLEVDMGDFKDEGFSGRPGAVARPSIT